MFHFLLHITGGDNGSGPFYLELSGFVGLLGFVGAFITYYKKHNCHQHRCWRIGRHAVAGGSLITCKKHHPDHSGKKITAEHIMFHHLNHKKLNKEQSNGTAARG